LTHHAGFLSRASDAKAIRLSWTHVIGMDALARDLCPETLEGFLALRGREAQEGFSEDDFPT